MELLNHPLRRNADGADEEGYLLLDHDIHQRVKLTASVVLVGLARIATNLREQEVEAEGDSAGDRVAGVEHRLEALALLTAALRRHANGWTQQGRKHQDTRSVPTDCC